MRRCSYAPLALVEPAISSLDVIHERCAGVEGGLFQSFEFVITGVDLDNVSSAYNRGVCFSNSTGGTLDEAKVVDLFVHAAEDGDECAMCYLGGCYFHGHGPERDTTKGVELYTRAANADDAKSVLILGYLYYFSDGGGDGRGQC
jgi:TPR repeat protein